MRKRHLTKFYGITTSKVRVKRLPREAAAYIMLRRKGQSINNIASLVGRSFSFVHRILKNIRSRDLRKLPRVSRLFHAAKMRFFMLKYGAAWLNFILGEGEKPP